jgi:hypothetical protein
MPSLESAYATHITTPDSGIDHARKQGFELKMPDDKYKDISPNQTGFSKAAVDRCVRAHACGYDLPSVFALWVRAWTCVCVCVCVRAYD